MFVDVVFITVAVLHAVLAGDDTVVEPLLVHHGAPVLLLQLIRWCRLYAVACELLLSNGCCYLMNSALGARVERVQQIVEDFLCCFRSCAIKEEPRCITSSSLVHKGKE